MDSFGISILAEPRITMVVIEGELSLKSMITVAEAIYAEPGYDPDYNCIMDLRHTTVTMTYQDMFAYVNRIANDQRRIRGATVFVTQDPTNFGMVRMFENLSIELPENLYFEKTLEAAMTALAEREE